MKNKFNILITEPVGYSKKAIALYKSFGRVAFLSDEKKEKKQEFFSTNILVIRLAHRIDASWMGRMPNLKIIASPTTGLNHIDLLEARKRRISVISLQGRTSFLKHVTSTAEETIGLIFMLARKLPWAFEDVKRGNWNRDEFRGIQLKGKTLGIIGYGRLGKMVARYAKTFGMNVLKLNRTMASNKAYGAFLTRLLRESDVISLHASFNSEPVLGEKHFQIMKPTAYFINTARGELVDERAMLRALKQKWIAGAALDVLSNERGDGDHLTKGVGKKLLEYAKTHNNLSIVPHLGGATQEAMQITEDFIADLVKKEALHFNKNKKQ